MGGVRGRRRMSYNLWLCTCAGDSRGCKWPHHDCSRRDSHGEKDTSDPGECPHMHV